MAKNIQQERIKRLHKHLQQENPQLADVVLSFQKLDRIARSMGLLAADDSFANQVSWWPVISVLGTFSAGKSTFLNQYVGDDLQRTGNQAVDDKFTVICYGAGETNNALPGLALDSDPRFPFYRISHGIEKVAAGEGRRVDSYLQLKTCKADILQGKIFIDSPGFDADQQRNSTLTIIDHIIDLSDLVLVFFDARHPEPGAMADTLKHLVSNTINRADANKFLYILNQIDNTAKEDNPEEVVAAWQRALAQAELTAGRFYRIYRRDAKLEGVDDQVRMRLERMRDDDLNDIEARIHQVEVERAYRVVGVLEKTARHIADNQIPKIVAARKSWRRNSLWLSSVTFMVVGVVFAWGTIQAGYWDGFILLPFAKLEPNVQIAVVAIATTLVALMYFKLCAIAGKFTLKKLRRDSEPGAEGEAIINAFQHNLKAWWRSVGSLRPRGWGGRRRRQLNAVMADADKFVQALNDRYAHPSGGQAAGKSSTPAATAEKPAPADNQDLSDGKAEPDPAKADANSTS
jgi:hypothetical protein